MSNLYIHLCLFVNFVLARSVLVVTISSPYELSQPLYIKEYAYPFLTEPLYLASTVSGALDELVEASVSEYFVS